MNILKIGGREFKFPSQWNEVQPKDFRKIAKRFLQSVNKPQLKCIFLSAYIPKNTLRKIDAERLHTICEKLDWLFDFDFSGDLLPKINIYFRGYYSLGKKLERCTLNNFSHLDYYFWAYHTKKDEQYLNKLCASLFTKNKKFDSEQVSINEKLFSHLPAYLKSYALLYFDSCKKVIIKKFEKLFQKGGNSNAPPDWNSIIISLAGEDITRLDAVGEQPIYSALMYLQRAQEKQKELEKQK